MICGSYSFSLTLVSVNSPASHTVSLTVCLLLWFSGLMWSEWAHPDYPGWSSTSKSITSILPAKSFLPYSVFIGSKEWSQASFSLRKALLSLSLCPLAYKDSHPCHMQTTSKDSKCLHPKQQQLKVWKPLDLSSKSSNFLTQITYIRYGCDSKCNPSWGTISLHLWRL